MQFSLQDSVCMAGSDPNEDRVGLTPSHAWVIDGATDVLEERLLPGPSDAAWLAGAFDSLFAQLVSVDRSLEDAIAEATGEVRRRFDELALRPIGEPHEQPSAAGILTRLVDGHLEAIGLGDCTLLALSDTSEPVDLLRGDDERDGDEAIRIAAARVREERPRASMDGSTGVRAELLPMLRAARVRMNQSGGYGVLSVTLAPNQHFQRVRRRVEAGDRFLFATDGFMRLVDVYGLHSLGSLGQAVRDDGLAALLLELRAFEAKDPDGHLVPRVKAADDAAAMIVSVTD